jgi:hypothetical protein
MLSRQRQRRASVEQGCQRRRVGPRKGHLVEGLSVTRGDSRRACDRFSHEMNELIANCPTGGHQPHDPWLWTNPAISVQHPTPEVTVVLQSEWSTFLPRLRTGHDSERRQARQKPLHPDADSGLPQCPMEPDAFLRQSKGSRGEAYALVILKCNRHAGIARVVNRSAGSIGRATELAAKWQ